jgi:polycomb protein EED
MQIEEVFYSCAWTVDEPTGAPLLAVAGKRGIIKIVNCSMHVVVSALLGHGNAINQVMFHPVDPGLLLSCSRDESLRLWNSLTGLCIAVFGGHQGHRDEVLSMVGAFAHCCVRIFIAYSSADS